MNHNQKKLLMYGGIALGVVVLWKMFGKHLIMEEPTTSSDDDSQDASFLNASSGARCRCNNGFEGWCTSGNCTKCCGKFGYGSSSFVEGDDFLIGEESTYNASGDRIGTNSCASPNDNVCKLACANMGGTFDPSDRNCYANGVAITGGVFGSRQRLVKKNFMGDGNEFSSEEDILFPQ